MNGKTLGHYRVGEQLGRGGMGEVYVADDLNLNRKVALKFLPDAFTGDPERMARFEREAKLLASLNHPNIAAIYGLEQAEGKRFIVMELAEGETLAQGLGKGRLPVDEALGICKQVAEGLEAAHEKGVIHRDLKPANIMITEGNKVKILDFGLAKALSDETQSVDSSQSPTLTEAMTRPGIILGTAAYMSPEQAKGKAVDKRSDIWAFGCILYECLTGKKAFEGETVTETLASILRADPGWEALPAMTPPNLRFVLSRCLDKDVSRRFRDAADIRIQIEESQSFPPLDQSPNTKRHKALAVIAIAVLMVLFPLTFLLGKRYRTDATATSPVLRFSFQPTDITFDIGGRLYPVISPDGRWIVFGRNSLQSRTLWIRDNTSGAIRELPGTDDVHATAFWSPDSRQVAFPAQGKLKRIEIVGSSPITVCALPASGTWYVNGSWNREGTIVFGGYGWPGLFRVAASGGTPAAITKRDATRELAHLNPSFLPDGRRFLFWMLGPANRNSALYICSLDNPTPVRLTDSDSGGLYSEPGYLLFIRQGWVVAEGFNAKSLSIEGKPSSLLQDAQPGSLSVSGSGILSYVTGRESIQLTWIDRTGRELRRVTDIGGDFPTFNLSRDGSRVVLTRREPAGQTNLWVIDLARGSASRLTLDEANNHVDPRWSPDGREVIFGSTRDPARSPFQVSLPGSDPIQIYRYNGSSFALDDWSPDGRYLIYHDSLMSALLWALPLSGDRKPFEVTRSLSGQQDQARFSPDGRWIAYNTSESGRFEVKVVPFPAASDKWQISTAGGVQPTWRGDGRELYFLAPDGTLMAVEVRPGKSFEWGEVRPLFNAEISLNPQIEQYAPAPDGKRFLFVKPAEGNQAASATIVTNWQNLLKR